MLAVPEQAGHGGRDPDFDGLVLEFALPVAGVFAADNQAPGTAVDPAQDTVGSENLKVAADGGARSVAGLGELLHRNLGPVAQQLTDQPMPLFSLHAQMLTNFDHLITRIDHLPHLQAPAVTNALSLPAGKTLTLSHR